VPDDGERWVIVRVDGCCMEPRIPRGSYAYADPDRAPVHGDVVVADRDGELVVKELREHAGERYLTPVAGHGRPTRVDRGTRVLGVVVAAVLRVA
jgi:SOS-response transcriptional repressor LexA